MPGNQDRQTGRPTPTEGGLGARILSRRRLIAEGVGAAAAVSALGLMGIKLANKLDAYNNTEHAKMTEEQARSVVSHMASEIAAGSKVDAETRGKTLAELAADRDVFLQYPYLWTLQQSYSGELETTKILAAGRVIDLSTPLDDGKSLDSRNPLARLIHDRKGSGIDFYMIVQRGNDIDVITQQDPELAYIDANGNFTAMNPVVTIKSERIIAATLTENPYFTPLFGSPNAWENKITGAFNDTTLRNDRLDYSKKVEKPDPTEEMKETAKLLGELVGAPAAVMYLPFAYRGEQTPVFWVNIVGEKGSHHHVAESSSRGSWDFYTGDALEHLFDISNALRGGVILPSDVRRLLQGGDIPTQTTLPMITDTTSKDAYIGFAFDGVPYTGSDRKAKHPIVLSK